jgi:hypothetical protein
MSWDAAERMLHAMVEQQDAKVLALARRVVPHLTPEDVRNPHDFPALVESAEFNYEDGVLAGLRAAETAVRAARRDADASADTGRDAGGAGSDRPPGSMDTRRGR